VGEEEEQLVFKKKEKDAPDRKVKRDFGCPAPARRTTVAREADLEDT
jgi:hypothetical protein